MIPTKEHWGRAWEGLDEGYAFDHFYGKTLEEAEDMMHYAPQLYCEDFLYMPKVPFQFYLNAFIKYLSSERSRYDFDAANRFIHLIKIQLDLGYGDWMENHWQSIYKMLNHLADQQEFYDTLTKPDKFRKRVNQIIEKQTLKGVKGKSN